MAVRVVGYSSLKLSAVEDWPSSESEAAAGLSNPTTVSNNPVVYSWLY